MRIAMLGSLGVARPFNWPRKMVFGTPALLQSSGAATYAAVAPGAHLDLVVVGVPGTLVIPFTGAENTALLYAATINAVRQAFFQNGGFAATVVTGDLSLTPFLLGSMGGITVAATTSAAVLVSLGFASGQLSIPSSGVGLGTPHMRAAAIAFFGGVQPVGPLGLLPANQHGATIRWGLSRGLVMVDRNAPTQGPGATSSDNTRFAPLHSEGPPGTAPDLGLAAPYAVLGGTTVTNTVTATAVNGSLGISPGAALTNFPPGVVVGGTTDLANAASLAAQNAVIGIYNDLAAQGPAVDLTGQNLGGMTLAPGIYSFAAGAQLTGDLILDAGGDPNAIWIFQTGTTLIAAVGSNVFMAGGGIPANVFWKVGSSATINAGTDFIGTIVALTAVTFGTLSTLVGRAWARNAAVALDNNTLTLP